MKPQNGSPSPADAVIGDNERQLLVYGARQSLSKDIQDRIQALLQQPLRWDLVEAGARQHGVAPLIYHSLSTLPEAGEHVPEATLNAFRAEYAGSLHQSSVMRKALAELVDVLRAEHVKAVVLKGAALRETVYSDPALRPLADLDLLVRREQLQQATLALKSIGYAFHPDALPARLSRLYHFNLPFVRPGRPPIEVELHWALTDRFQPYALPVDSFLDRAIAISMADTDMWILSTEDLVLHLCLHLHMHGFLNAAIAERHDATSLVLHPLSQNRLIWFADLHEIFERNSREMTWQAFVHQCRETRTEDPVFTSLSLLQGLYPHSVNDTVLSELTPPRVGRLKRALTSLIASAASKPGPRTDRWPNVARRLLRKGRVLKFRPVRLLDLLDRVLRRGRSRPPERSTGQYVAFLFALACAVYLNSLWNPFVFDDRDMIVRHPYTRGVRNVAAIFQSGQRAVQGSYRPMVTLSFAANYDLGGLDPFGYHLVNVLLHGANTGLIYLVLLRLLGSNSVALASSLIFAVHPIHTEAVTPASGRTEVLSAFFFLTAWLSYLKGRYGIRRQALWIGISILAFLAALLSKRHTLMLPVILVLSDILLACRHPAQVRPLPGSLFRQALKVLPLYFIAIGVYLFLFHRMYSGPFLIPATEMLRLDNPLVTSGPYPRILTFIKILAHYLQLMIWPLRLSPDYSFNQIPVADAVTDPGVMAGLLTVAALVGLPLFAFRRRPDVWFGALFLLIMLAPTSNIIVNTGTIMAERLMYLPSVGVCLLAGIVGGRLVQTGREHPSGPVSMQILLLPFVIVLALLGGRTVARNRDWKDEYRLWKKAVMVAPESAKAHYDLGCFAHKRGLLGEAEEHYTEAIRIAPFFAKAYVNLGAVLLEKGALDEAVAHYRDALEVIPEQPLFCVNLGTALMKRGDHDSALAMFRKAATINPRLAIAHYNQVAVLARMGDWTQAVAVLQQAMELQPDFPEGPRLQALIESRGE